jgi:5'-nucleotidase
MSAIVLVDMDGVLADFDLHFWNRCTAEGYVFDVDHHLDQRHRYFTDHIPDSEHRQAARLMVDSEGWFRDLPVIPGAVEGMDALCSAGLDVWVCSKPLDSNPTGRDEKAAWLTEYFPDFAERLILAPDKSMILGHVLLDDAPKLPWLERASWDAVVFAQPFNGPGSKWGHLPHWTWGDPLADLLLAPAVSPAERSTARAAAGVSVRDETT